MNTKEMIAVMQAYEDGKQIEYNARNGWRDVTTPVWDWHTKKYRIKTTKKPVDLSVLIESGIDCEFSCWKDFSCPSISPLAELANHVGNYIPTTNIDGKPYVRPRMNHPHAWQGGDCPLPFNTMVRIHYRDYVRANESYVKRAGDCYWEHRKEPHGLDIIAFEVISLHEDYCYPWELEND